MSNETKAEQPDSVTQPVVKAPPKAAKSDKGAGKTPAAKPAPQKVASSKPATPAAKPEVAKPAAAKPAAVKPAKTQTAKAGKAEKGDDKSKKDKKAKESVIRDSFSMPADDYALLKSLKARGLTFGVAIKKSELVRAGLRALQGMDDAKLKATLSAIETIKTGRPAKNS